MTCKEWCGTKRELNGSACMRAHGNTACWGPMALHLCSKDCGAAGRPLHPASPAAEAGGLLTFAEACDAPAGTVEMQWADDKSAMWFKFAPDQTYAASPAMYLKARYRLKPAPTPRCKELARERAERLKWSAGMESAARGLLKDGVKEALDRVEKEFLHDDRTMSDVLDELRREYLGEGGGK